MILVDSHCHLDLLDLSPYQGDLSVILQAAQHHQVQHFLSVGLTLAQSQAVINLAESHASVSASVGIHPTEIAQPADTICYDVEREQLMLLAKHPKVIAIGETGLDYYQNADAAMFRVQQERFTYHIDIAKKLQKPLIIHTRNAPQETITLLKQENARDIGGVLHCFTEDWTMAKQAMDLNFYISFSGIITFKNALKLQSVVKKIPLDRLLIETDSPYLAPVPYRGKPNVPAYVRYVAENIALLRQESLSMIAHHTTKNFFDLFTIADSKKINN